MRRAPWLFLLLVARILAVPTCTAQSLGLQPYGSYSKGFDTISVYGLAPHIDIPLYTHAARGSDISMEVHLIYDDNFFSSSFYPGDIGWHIGPSVGHSGILARNLYSNIACPKSPPGTTPNTNTTGTYSWSFIDSSGYNHTYAGHSTESNCTSGTVTTTSFTGYPVDGAGYQIHANGDQATVTDPSGRIIPLNGISVTDQNGNSGAMNSLLFNGTSQTFTDNTNNSITTTGGLNAYTYSTGVETSRSPFTLTYNDSSGNSRMVTVNYKVYSVARASIWGSTNTVQAFALVDNVQLADGSQYKMTYQPTPGVSGAVTGRLASITFPTGGTISYAYGDDPSWSCGLQTQLVRTTPDGVTTYGTSVTATTTNSCVLSSTTTINHADGGSETVSFITPGVASGQPQSTMKLETAHAWLDAAGHTLRSTMRCYNGATGNCTAQAFTLPISQISTTTTLDNGQQSQAVSFLNATGLQTELDEYDYGATAITRKTVTQYASLGNNIVDKPSNIVVYDSSGTVVRKTTYGYDETAVSAAAGGATIPKSVPVSGSRGNMTTKTDWISSTTSAATTYAYDSAGQVVSEQDQNSNVTSYVFDTATDTYLTQRTLPTTNSVQHVDHYSTDPATGMMISHTDPNGVVTAFEYNDPFLRLTKTRTAAGASGESWIQYKYDSPNQTRTLVDKVTMGDAVLVSKSLSDSLGRPSNSISPSGAEVDSAYDNMGRIYSKTNPYFSGQSSPVLTTFGYDALGRKTSESYPDGNKKTWSYSGSTVTSNDEANHPWVRTSDALGRLVTVTEPGALSTSYFYSGADDLTSVKQSGTGSDTVRIRSFSYDLLSRLIYSNNPETGAISYSYLNSGNRCSGNPVLPCTKTDARGITTTYNYDALNRLLSKTYPAGTPSSCYQYDQSSLVSSGGNLIGRLTNSWTQTGSCPASAAPPSFQSASILSRKSILAYDAMGRALSQQQCTKSNCNTSTSYSPAYSYDLAGNLITHSSGIGSGPFALTFTNGYDGAGHLCSVLNGAATLFAIPQYVAGSGCTSANPTLPGYSAAGGLMNATFGTGLQLSRSYDNRLRISSETDTGNATPSQTPGAATITISGTDQTH